MPRQPFDQCPGNADKTRAAASSRRMCRLKRLASVNAFSLPHATPGLPASARDGFGFQVSSSYLRKAGIVPDCVLSVIGRIGKLLVEDPAPSGIVLTPLTLPTFAVFASLKVSGAIARFGRNARSRDSRGHASPYAPRRG